MLLDVLFDVGVVVVTFETELGVVLIRFACGILLKFEELIDDEDDDNEDDAVRALKPPPPPPIIICCCCCCLVLLLLLELRGMGGGEAEFKILFDVFKFTGLI